MEEKKRKEAPQVRRITNAPPPPTEVGGRGWTSSRPKPTQIPPNFPNYYPNELKLQTQLIYAEAVRKYPTQTQTLELCKYVISQLTPHFRVAVQVGAMRADQVLSDSGMKGVLYSLLVYNCDSGIEINRLDQEARKSDEWMKLAQIIVDAAVQKSGGKSGRSAKVTPLGQKIDKLRMECGWSVEKLAEKTGMDKKLVLSHLNKPVKPYPKNLKLYAQAFTRELGREITVADIEK